MRNGLLTGREVLERAPGYMGSSFQQGLDEPQSFILRVEWESVAAHEQFKQTPQFQDWRSPFAQFVDGKSKVGHYQVFTDGG